MSIKAKEAALAVIIAGIGVGIAILADNIISERRYVQAKLKIDSAPSPTHLDTIVEGADESSESSEIAPPPLSTPAPAVPPTPPPSPASSSSDEETSVDEFIEKEVAHLEHDNHEGCIPCEKEKARQRKKQKKIMKALRHIAEQEKQNAQTEYEKLQKSEDLLPGETYAEFYLRQQRIKEEMALQQQVDLTYTGDFNEPSKNLYLTKRAYVEARTERAPRLV